MGISPALPSLARSHPLWQEIPSGSAELEARRKTLREAVQVSGRRIRSLRAWQAAHDGADATTVAVAEQVMMCRSQSSSVEQQEQ